MIGCYINNLNTIEVGWGLRIAIHHNLVLPRVAIVQSNPWPHSFDFLRLNTSLAENSNNLYDQSQSGAKNR